MLKPYWYKVDWTLLVPIILLASIGIVMMYSTSSIVGFSNYNDAYFFIKRHLIFCAMGCVALVIGMLIPHQWYQKHLSKLIILVIALLALTLTPVGVKIGGAQRWLNLGLLRFQPVEVAKFGIIVFLATGLSRPKNYLTYFFKGCFPLLAVISVPLALICLQPDLGNTGIILVVTLFLFFLSPMPLRHLMSLAMIGLSGLVGMILTHPYQMKRIAAFLDPWGDPLGKSYHIVQSLIAIGSGGLTGLGLGESKLKYFYLPLQYSDFIFSIICEEGGFILATIIILLYVSILVKSYYCVRQADSSYSFYLGMGCAGLLCFQALINIAVVIGLLPVTGIPLTFISFGGTSLITSFFYVGILLNISNSIKRKEYVINK